MKIRLLALLCALGLLGAPTWATSHSHSSHHSSATSHTTSASHHHHASHHAARVSHHHSRKASVHRKSAAHLAHSQAGRRSLHQTAPCPQTGLRTYPCPDSRIVPVKPHV